jgi:hypothetical protein
MIGINGYGNLKVNLNGKPVNLEFLKQEDATAKKK